ncbi:hypothetical protein [Sphingopyxis sp. NFH-91]|uniref:hypothetical protein n=1 Tax=Sphingopyxis sp. NFH-91 TaxID=2744457 RepID=UPI001F409F1F|nr:hypothetical protein [Sphingopyxis sp. NFH-91]
MRLINLQRIVDYDDGGAALGERRIDPRRKTIATSGRTDLGQALLLGVEDRAEE